MHGRANPHPSFVLQCLPRIRNVGELSLVLRLQRLHAAIEHADQFVERQTRLNLKLRVLVDRTLDVLGLSDVLSGTLERRTPRLHCLSESR